MPQEERSIFDLNVGEVQDLTPASEGEHPLEIVRASIVPKKDDDSRFNIKVVVKVTNEEAKESIFHYLPLPSGEDDKELADGKTRRIKDFQVGFGIPFGDQVDTDTWVGATGFGIIGAKNYEGRDGAEIKKILKTAGSR